MCTFESILHILMTTIAYPCVPQSSRVLWTFIALTTCLLTGTHSSKIVNSSYTIRTGRLPLHEAHFRGRENSACEASLVSPMTHSMFSDLKLSKSLLFSQFNPNSSPIFSYYFSEILFPKIQKVSVSQLGKLSFANKEESREPHSTSLPAIVSVFPIWYISVNFSQTLGPTLSNIKSLL